MSRPTGLGDRVESALSLVGITSERVSEWIGEPCNCDIRREKLNALGYWASRVLHRGSHRAKEYLEQIMKED